MGKKLLSVVILAVYALIILLPPLIYGYVYPNSGDDTAVHLEKFSKLAEDGMDVPVQYAAYRVVGFPVLLVSQWIGKSMEVVYLWFNYVMLILAGTVIYFVTAKLVDKLAGWLALLFAVFSSQGLMWQFYYGQIFNLINVGIIFPILIYSVVNYINCKKPVFLLGSIGLAFLFGGFHASGVYLPVIAGLATTVYLLYALLRKAMVNWRLVWLGSGIVVASVVAFVIAVVIPLMRDVDSGVLMTNIGKSLSVPYVPFLLDIVSPTILVVVLASALFARDIALKISKKALCLAFVLFCAVMVLGVVAFGGVSLDPWRQAIDFAILLPVLVAVLTRYLLDKRHLALVMVVIFGVVFGLYHNVPTWFSYTSAMRPADVQAVAYLDGYDTFSVSDTVAPWIYTRFTKAEWRTSDGDVVVVRNKPMTPRSDPENIWFEHHGWVPSDGYKLVKTFIDRDVVVEVYAK